MAHRAPPDPKLVMASCHLAIKYKVWHPRPPEQLQPTSPVPFLHFTQRSKQTLPRVPQFDSPLPPWAFFFFFVFLSFSRAAPVAYGGSQARGRIGAAANPSSVCSSTAHVNARSLTHWARPGIKPATSWFPVGFVNHWATTGTPRMSLYKSSQGLLASSVLHHVTRFLISKSNIGNPWPWVKIFTIVFYLLMNALHNVIVFVFILLQ